MKRTVKKFLAAMLGGICTLSALPVSQFAGAETLTGETVIYETGFEDGVVNFTGRGGAETIATTSDYAYEGSYSLGITNREKSWNGPQFLLDDLCTAGEKYICGAWVRTDWYNTVNLSMEYTDSSGERKYFNLASVVSQGEWAQIPDTKFSFPEDVTNVYVYFECSDTCNLYVDNFSLRSAATYSIQQDIPSLKDVYADYFKIGGAVTTAELAPQTTKDLILKHYNSITLGNELKPENVLDHDATLAYLAETGDNTTPQLTIADARSILNFCRDNNMPVRGHVLVWHSQTPGWFFKDDYTDSGEWVTTDVMLQRMENYIKGVMELLAEEYPTVEFYAWDVVNEAWLDDGSPRTGGTYEENSNYSGWVKVFGDNSFIPYAFEYARKYAPEGCMLYYNDYNEYMPNKTTAIVNMANELKEQGLIDGIGMQSHLAAIQSGTTSFPGISVYRSALAKFVATGLDIQVTELDATIDTYDNSEESFELQAQYYSDIMDALVEYSDSISAVVFWGTTDDQSWRATRFPLLFNEDYTAKPAYYAIIDGLTTETPELGDINMSGSVTIADAILLQKHLLNSAPLTADQCALADLDEDGVITAFDFAALKRVLLGQ